MRGLRIVAAVATAVIMILGMILGMLLGAGAAPVAASAKGWDPRIADLAHAVERLRGLEFEHAVPVRVLDDAAFEKQYTKGQKVSENDRKELDRTSASLLAIGLLEQPLDPDSLSEDFGSRVLGYYDDHRQEIVVRGDTFDSASTRATLAHELTHALQDQHFDIRKLSRKAHATESGVPRALIEGDATRIGESYEAGLTEAEQADIKGHDAAVLDASADLPPILGITTSGSYYLGEVMTLLLDADGGPRAVDAAFRKPPLDDLVMLDPVALLDRFRSAPVPPPKLTKGEHALGKSYVFGAWGLYLTFASRLPTTDALEAAERWGGDSYVTFERGTTPCVRVAVAGRNGRADADALDATFRAWAAAAPSDAQTEVDGDTVTLTSCAPAVGAAPVSEGTMVRALMYVALRNSIAVSGVTAKLDPDQAKCLGTELLRVPEVSSALDSLTSIDTEPPADFENRLTTAVSKNAAAIRARCV
jgi:hypothetical protein